MRFESSCRLFSSPAVVSTIAIEVSISMLSECLKCETSGGNTMVKEIVIALIGVFLIVAVVLDKKYQEM